MIRQIFTPLQSEEIAGRLGGAMVVIKGKKMLSAAWFSIEEICNGEWSIGGTRVNQEHALVAGSEQHA